MGGDLRPLEQMKAMEALITDINRVLGRHGIDDRIELSDIVVTDRTVSDLVKTNARLSDAVVNHVWPSMDSLCNGIAFYIESRGRKYSKTTIPFD